jgi:hypothetical protein
MSNGDVPDRLQELIDVSHLWARALSKETDRLRHRGRLLGYLVTVMTTVTGAAIFTQLNENPSTTAKLIFGVVSLLAAVLSGLNTFGAFADRATKAQISSAGFGSVYGTMLDASDRIRRGKQVSQGELRSMYERFEELNKERPSIPNRVMKQAEEEIRKKAKVA